MKYKLSRRIFILEMLLAIASCTTEETLFNQSFQLVIGIISYGQEKQTVERLSGFRKYLSEQLRAIIQIEPAFNERMAIERMKRYSWSLVFATPGLAAVGISNYEYSAIFPLQLSTSSRSIIIVRQDSTLKTLQDLQGKTIALGQQGSATSYYIPLYNLYGLTLASILFASTPQLSLEWVDIGKVDAAAISLEDFNFYKSKFNSSGFRILFRDFHPVPSGAVLISPNIERKRVDMIRDRMKNAPLPLVTEAKYIPSASPPDYEYMIRVVKRVAAIAQNLDSKPVRLFN